MNLRRVPLPKLTAQNLDKPILSDIFYSIDDIKNFINNYQNTLIILDIIQQLDNINYGYDYSGNEPLQNYTYHNYSYLIIYQEK